MTQMFVRKLTSRKLWVSLVGLAAGLALAFGAEEGDLQGVIGAVAALLSSLSYVLSEAKVDAARALSTGKEES